ncbi:hypothetical protein ACI2IP_07435 [Microbacterium sp. NPDC090218]
MTRRIAYIGRSAEDLGVRVPGDPPIRCGFTFGVKFPGSDQQGDTSPFVEPDTVIVDVQREEDADMLVLKPGEFDDPDVVIVVVVNERSVYKPRLYREIAHLTSASPDGPSRALVFAPERSPGARWVTGNVQACLDEKCISAEALPYHPSN